MPKQLVIEDQGYIAEVVQRLRDLRDIAKTGRDRNGDRVQLTGLFPTVIKDLEQQLGHLVFEALEPESCAPSCPDENDG